ncbi:MAG TPA: hypothetical protein VGQ00_04485 [Candidatus Norongarragalinales archaeon]|jgi:hypothetical protein|nr:hypothetical protein [Candidatus Norongarragalinales archaeon]
MTKNVPLVALVFLLLPLFASSLNVVDPAHCELNGKTQSCCRYQGDPSFDCQTCEQTVGASESYRCFSPQEIVEGVAPGSSQSSAIINVPIRDSQPLSETDAVVILAAILVVLLVFIGAFSFFTRNKIVHIHARGDEHDRRTHGKKRH